MTGDIPAPPPPASGSAMLKEGPTTAPNTAIAEADMTVIKKANENACHRHRRGNAVAGVAVMCG